jgi:hypothetical protein
MRKPSPEMAPIHVRVTFSETPTDALALLERLAASRGFATFKGRGEHTFSLAPVARDAPRPALPWQWTDPTSNITLDIGERGPPPPQQVVMCTRVCVVPNVSPQHEAHPNAYTTVMDSIRDTYRDWDMSGPSFAKDKHGNKVTFVWHRSRVPLSIEETASLVQRSTTHYSLGRVYSASERYDAVPSKLLPRHGGSPSQDDHPPSPTQPAPYHDSSPQHSSPETTPEDSQEHPNTDPQADSLTISPAALHEDSHSDTASSDDDTQGPSPDTHPPAATSPPLQRKRANSNQSSQAAEGATSPKRPQPHPQPTPQWAAPAIAQDTAHGLHTRNLAETATNMPVDTPDDSFDSSPSIESYPLSRQSSGGASQ